MLTASLDVQGDQVEAELLARFCTISDICIVVKRASTVTIYRGNNIQEVRSATKSLWEPWKRWLVTSCDMESSRACATCKVPPHGYLDHHNAANDDDNCMFFSDLVDQTHEVGVSPSSLVQVVRLLQHLRQLLAPNISETQFFFFQIVVGCAMYKTYFIEAKSLSCYPKIFSPLQGKRQF